MLPFRFLRRRCLEEVWLLGNLSRQLVHFFAFLGRFGHHAQGQQYPSDRQIASTGAGEIPDRELSKLELEDHDERVMGMKQCWVDGKAEVWYVEGGACTREPHGCV